MNLYNWCIKLYKDKYYLVIQRLDNQGYYDRTVCKIELEKIKNKIKELNI